MSDIQKGTASEAGGPATRRNPDAGLRPPVDIFEDADGITVLADIPGVSRDRLRVEVDNDTLLIEGDSALDMPAGMEALYADIRLTSYRRVFTLSGELQKDNIHASLKDGVLTLHIPKRAEARPRKIAVSS